MFKKIFLLGLIISSFGSLLAQPNNIENGLSDQHIQIQGTKVAMIPPNEFTPASDFKGFTLVEEQASIMVIEVPAPFSAASQGFTKENLASRGMTLISQEDLTLNGKQAILLKVQQFLAAQSFIKWLLVFGDDKNMIVVNGVMPEDYAEARSQSVREAILSTVYEEGKEVDLLGNADFSIDYQATKFQFATEISGTFLFTCDGQVPTQSEDKTFFMAGKSLWETPIENPKLFAIQRINQFSGYTPIELEGENTQPVEVNGLFGYEIFMKAWNEKDQHEDLLYQVILYDERLYYIFVGVATENFEENLSLFKSLTNSFQRK